MSSMAPRRSCRGWPWPWPAAGNDHQLERQRELLAQLHDLLLLPPPLDSTTTDECSAVTDAPAALPEARRRRRGSKRARHADDQPPAPAAACGGNKRISRRNKEAETRFETTVPDIDGYLWRKYGQKLIEGAHYPRSYYRCTNSADQGCPAKRTVQRTDGDVVHGGAAPKYTVVYIGEHTCKTVESLAPVILETTVRPSRSPSDDDATITTAASPAGSTTTGVESPAISSTAASSVDYEYCWPYRTTTTPAAAALPLQDDVDFTGPIRSPDVHIAAECWIDDDDDDQCLLVGDEPSIHIPSSCLLFGRL